MKKYKQYLNCLSRTPKWVDAGAGSKKSFVGLLFVVFCLFVCLRGFKVQKNLGGLTERKTYGFLFCFGDEMKRKRKRVFFTSHRRNKTIIKNQEIKKKEGERETVDRSRESKKEKESGEKTVTQERK
jgi:hypothetical protein